MSDALENAELRRRIAAIELYLPRIQLRPLPQDNKLQIVQIIGGNTINSVQCIKYTADDPTLSKIYDPDVDTIYPDGLGYGWLWVNGFKESRVLVRHDYGGDTAPLMGQQAVGGWTYPVRGTKTLTVTVNQVVTAMTAYCVTWTP